jgi:hypothetical protein
MSERRYWLSRIGSVCAIVGALGAVVGNILHPVTPRDDPVGVARVIAESDAWTLIHVVIIFGLILMVLGLVTIGYSVEGGVAEALALWGSKTPIALLTSGFGGASCRADWCESPFLKALVRAPLQPTEVDEI